MVIQLKNRKKISSIWKKSKHYKKYRQKIWYPKRYFNKVIRKKWYKKGKLRALRANKRIRYPLVIKKLIFIKSRYKKFIFSIAKQRVDAIRIKKFLFQFNIRTTRKTNWINHLRRGFKIILGKIASRHSKKRHAFKFLFRFYKLFGLKRFYLQLLKYSRLKRILIIKKQKFIQKRKKNTVIKKLEWTRIRTLKELNYFMSCIIDSGRFSTAERFYEQFLTLLKFKYKTTYLKKYFLSLERIRPLILYRTIYTGGKKYRIPILMPISKSYKIAARWLIANARVNSNNLPNALFSLVNNSIKNEGAVVKQRKEYHLLSFENKSYIYLLRFLKKGFA